MSSVILIKQPGLTHQSLSDRRSPIQDDMTITDNPAHTTLNPVKTGHITSVGKL